MTQEKLKETIEILRYRATTTKALKDVYRVKP